MSTFHIHCNYPEIREDNKVCGLLSSGYRSHRLTHTWRLNAIHLIKFQTRPVSSQQYIYFNNDSFCQRRPLTIFGSPFPSLFPSLLCLSVFSFLRRIQTTWSYGWRFSLAPMSDVWMWTLKSHLQGNCWLFLYPKVTGNMHCITLCCNRKTHIWHLFMGKLLRGLLGKASLFV